MISDDDLIAMLSDGEFHSGAALGRSLGVSRTAVWKHLQQLSEQGVYVESIKGKGYRIPGGMDFLNSQAISALIAPTVINNVTRLEVHRSLESTNSHIASLGEAGHGVVCLADQQIGGRGRRGRHWVSPLGRNIYFSMGWSFEDGAAKLEGLSLAVGISLCRAIARCCGPQEGLGIKWPNDVLYLGRKLAGILIEMSGDPNGLCHVVVGIGVNHGMALDHGKDIDQPWSDITQFGDISRNELVAEIVNQLIPLFTLYSKTGFGQYMDEWQKYDLCANQEVTLITPARNIQGRAVGVSTTGAIRIEVNGAVEEYSGGEISLRIAT